MNFTPLFAAGLAAAGLPAILRRLQERRRWEQEHRQVYLALSFEQMSMAATRAGAPLFDLLHECRHHGATHIAIREETLDGLLEQGAVFPVRGAIPGRHYLASNQPGLIDRLRQEFAARIPHTLVTDESAPDRDDVLALAGDLRALRHIGLGFNPADFRQARETGLQIIARPVSYPWPSPDTIERTLGQAAELGASIIAWAGDFVLGHEMMLGAVVESLRRHQLDVAYFPDRRQRGDWYIAKQAPERAVLALDFTPEELNLEDEHSAAHRAALRAREGNVRLVLADTFRGVHATSPTSILTYLDELVHALVHHEGFSIDIPEHHEHEHVHPDTATDHHHHSSVFSIQYSVFSRMQSRITDDWSLITDNWSLTTEQWPLTSDLALAALALAALDRQRALPLPAAVGLAGAVFVAATLIPPRLDRPRNALEHSYAPQHSSKLVALAALTAGPAAGPASLWAAPVAGLLAAAATTGIEYQRRIEVARTFHLDWTLPLALHLLAEPPARLAGPRRWLAALGLLALPAVGGRFLKHQDWQSCEDCQSLQALDHEHPSPHTHHPSTAQRLIGDARMALGARPLRKWSGLTLLWLLQPHLPAASTARTLAGLAATAGAIATAATLRHPTRPVERSVGQAAVSWLLMAPVILAARAALMMHADGPTP